MVTNRALENVYSRPQGVPLTSRVCGKTLQCDIALSAEAMASDASILAGADALSGTADDYTGMLKTAVFSKLWGCQGPYFVNCCSPDAVQENYDRKRVSICSAVNVGDSAPQRTDVLPLVKVVCIPTRPDRRGANWPRVAGGVRMEMVVPEWPAQPWYAPTKGHESVW